VNKEFVKEVSTDGSVLLTAEGMRTGRAKRVHDRLGIEPRGSSASPEESLVIDDRCDLSPAQMVETKLTRVLGGATLPVSHLQMRGLLRPR
jgi:hypothetical protein